MPYFLNNPGNDKKKWANQIGPLVHVLFDIDQGTDRRHLVASRLFDI